METSLCFCYHADCIRINSPLSLSLPVCLSSCISLSHPLSACLSIRVDPDWVPPRADVADHGGGVPAGDAGGGDAGGGRGSHHLPLSGPAAGVALQLPGGAAEQEEGGSDGGQLHQLHRPQDRRAAAQTGTAAQVISVCQLSEVIIQGWRHTGSGFHEGQGSACQGLSQQKKSRFSTSDRLESKFKEHLQTHFTFPSSWGKTVKRVSVCGGKQLHLLDTFSHYSYWIFSETLHLSCRRLSRTRNIGKYIQIYLSEVKRKFTNPSDTDTKMTFHS